MKLFLTSSGICSATLQEHYLRLLGRSSKSTKAIFVSTAAHPETNKGFVDIARREIQELSGTVSELDFKEASSRQVREEMLAADVIYVNGGNTFYLLYWARKIEFFENLQEFFKRGGIYVGVSAGSILACPTIELARWKGLDDPTVVELKSLVAASLVPFHLFPHYQDCWSDLVAEHKKKLRGELFLLRDGQAIMVNGEKVEVVGD